MKDSEWIDVIWSLALSDNDGDRYEAIEPILKHLEKKYPGCYSRSPGLLSEMIAHLTSINCRPDWSKEEDKN